MKKLIGLLSTFNYANIKIFCTNISIVFLLTSYASSSLADAQLMVSPTRIVFEGNKRTEMITLINSGTETGRYRVSMVRKKMSESGEFLDIKDDVPGKFADKLIRYAPRQVTLPPGKSQTIRVQLRKPKNLEESEYRSHMLFQKLPNESKTNIQNLSGNEQEGLKITIIPIVGISIPVIVRHGEINSVASLSDFELSLGNSQTPKPKLSMLINRDGKGSVFGDFKVEFKSNSGGEPIVVAQANGIAVYTTISKRKFSIDLQTPNNLSLADGELHVKYLEHGKSMDDAIIAEARISIPK